MISDVCALIIWRRPDASSQPILFQLFVQQSASTNIIFFPGDQPLVTRQHNWAELDGEVLSRRPSFDETVGFWEGKVEALRSQWKRRHGYDQVEGLVKGEH